MATVLIFCEQLPDGNLRKASLNALTAGAALAKAVGADLHAAVLAKDGAKLTDQVKEFGAKVVHAGTGAQFEHLVAEAVAPALAELAKSTGASWVGSAATAVGRDVMPRVAARLNAAMA